MNSKKIVAIILFLIMISAFASCNKNGAEEETVASQISLTNGQGEIVTDNPTEVVASVESTLSGEDNPAEWTVAQIIGVYKNAAAKSHSSVKSEQIIELKDVSVNNGEYENVFKFITPIMSKLLANNSKESNGITGGYANLTESDVASARAYKSGKNVVVEMVMKKQTAGANEDAMSGSVGHAITAVGDISVVTKQLDDLGLPLEISEKDTKIHYTNPVVKVVIDENGKIVNGTWKYTVEIRMNNYKAFGKTVKTTSVVMENTITVNGGFKK